VDCGVTHIKKLKKQDKVKLKWLGMAPKSSKGQEQVGSFPSTKHSWKSCPEMPRSSSDFFSKHFGNLKTEGVVGKR
jgi:hypothetical protein